MAFMTGQDLLATSITPYYLDSTGAQQFGSTLDFYEEVFAVRGRLRRQQEEISPIWEILENMVDIKIGEYLSLVTLEVNNATQNLILASVSPYTHGVVVWQQGIEIITCAYKLGDLQFGVENRGGNYCTLDLTPARERATYTTSA